MTSEAQADVDKTGGAGDDGDGEMESVFISLPRTRLKIGCRFFLSEAINLRLPLAGVAVPEKTNERLGRGVCEAHPNDGR